MQDDSRYQQKASRSILERLHLQQIGLFLWRRGIEFYVTPSPFFSPDGSQDVFGYQSFLEDLIDQNRLSLYLDDIWERGARTGEVLLYMRPHISGYQFLYYDATQFKPYYCDAGELLWVRIFSVEHLSDNQKVDVVTDLRRDRVDIWRGRSPQDFSPDESYPNPYGFVPAVVVQNRPVIGGRGKHEFDGLEFHIERYDWLTEQVAGNTEFFGGPLFFSSRSRSELIDAGLITSRYSVAEAHGYGSTPRSDRIKLKQVIDGLEPGEQIGFTTPQPIDSQVFNFINKYRSDILSTLGGRDVSTDDPTSATSSSIPIVTANRRATSYVTYGLARLYKLALLMAQVDGVLPLSDSPIKIFWRYSGDVFPDSPQTQLTKSIVSRNLIRLGVNLHDAIYHIFPDKRPEEVSALLEGGFAYELLNGVAQVGSRMDTDEQSNLVKILEDIIIKEVKDVGGKSRDRKQ